MRTSWKTRLLAIAGVALLALLAAACGGGDDDDDDGGGQTSAPAATQSQSNGDQTDGATDEPTETADGGDDDDGGDGLGFDVCGLLTEDEAEAVLGKPVTSEPQDFDPFFECSYQTEEFDSISVSLTERDLGEPLYNLDLDEENDPEDVDDVGDEAHYLTGLLPMLEVLEGDWYFSVSVTATDLEDEATKEASIEVGKKVADRLP
jgi:hypothetical protein